VIVLDTTVLAYAVGSEHPCRARIATLSLAGGNVRATTTVEVLQEFAHVRARRRGREDAAALARECANTST
jgi:predicted nucleic acid-binding protein